MSLREELRNKVEILQKRGPMSVEKFEQEPRELPGKVYETTAALWHDCEDPRSVGEGYSTLRFWGKKLTEMPSQTRPQKTYFEMVDSDNPNDYIDGIIFKIRENRYNLLVTKFDINVYNYERGDEYGRPEPATSFIITPDNIGDFRIEVVPIKRWQIEMREKFEKLAKNRQSGPRKNS